MKNQSFVAPLAFWAQAVNAAEIEMAIRAYERGDYSNALVSFHTLADQGNTQAQHHLGEMYANGHGVSRRRSRSPCDGTKKQPRVVIGSRRCSWGRFIPTGSVGLPPDRAKAYAWLSIAAANGDPEAAMQRDEAEQVMPMDELEEAQALYRQWLVD